MWLQSQTGLPLHKLFVDYRNTLSVVQYLAASVESRFAGTGDSGAALQWCFCSVKVSSFLLPGGHIVAVNGEVVATVVDLQDRVRGRDGKAKFTVLSWEPISKGPSQLSMPMRVLRCGEVDLDPRVLDGKIEDSCEVRPWVDSDFVVGFAADSDAKKGAQ
jgi:hypothetical protein